MWLTWPKWLFKCQDSHMLTNKPELQSASDQNQRGYRITDLSARAFGWWGGHYQQHQQGYLLCSTLNTNSVHHHQTDRELYVDWLKLTLEGTILDKMQICQYSPSWAWSRTLQQSRNSYCCQKSGSPLEAFKLNFSPLPEWIIVGITFSSHLHDLCCKTLGDIVWAISFLKNKNKKKIK